MTSIERTAYPRFKRLSSPRELHVFFTPQPGGVAWARGLAGSDEHLLAVVVMVKCFGRLGYFPALSEVPALVVDHVRRDLGLSQAVAAVYAARRTSRRHRDAIRQRVGVVRDPDTARAVAAQAIREAYGYRDYGAAEAKFLRWLDDQAWTTGDGPKALFVAAVAWLRRQRVLLPGVSTLAETVASVRHAAQQRLYTTLAGAVSAQQARELERILQVPEGRRRSQLDLWRHTERSTTGRG